MKKLLFLLVIAGFAALCPAPINEQPPDGYVPLPDHTQQQLVEEQRRQHQNKEVAQVGSDSDKADVKTEHSSATAENTLRAAAQQNAAAETVKKASRDLKAESGGLPMIFWGILFAVLGFGAVYAFRGWAAKNIPGPGGPRKHVSW